jgi:glucose-6-phosphate 1-dehydrogenase
VLPGTVTTLHGAGLPPGSRIVLEKPFGEDLDTARELNRLLAEVVPEQAMLRVDHFLAMTTVQNLLGSRLANRVLEPLWNSAHISEIEIVWDESLALEGRADYYDGVGALKDMVQNHLLQVLCLVAMEPPLSLGERDLRDRKMDVLRSVRPLTDEDSVGPRSRTETFAEVELRLESWRWSGPPSGSGAAKRSRTTARRSRSTFVPCPICPSATPARPSPMCSASGSTRRT